MEIEADPLNLKDPLDCSEDFEQVGVDSPGWVIQLEPEIVSDIVSKDVAAELELEKKPEPNLRIRKPKKRLIDDVIDIDWKLKPRKKKKTQKNGAGGKGTEKKSISDEENLVPATDKTKRVMKNKVKRENYLKKYKLMREKRGFMCDLCKKTFITASHLKEHMLSHCQCFPCKECHKVFNHLRSLQRHMAAGHNPEGKKDDSSVKKKEDVPDYLRTETAGDKNERCKKYYEQLKSERKYQCEICQKTFITSGHLNTHMYCHSEKKWKCEGCGKNFSCERSLSRHKDTFPGEHWFPCELCDMTFFRVINIVKHMEIKHPEASIDARCVRELNLTLGTEKEEENSIGSKSGGESGKGKVFVCTKCLKVFCSYDTLEIHKQAMHSSKKLEEESNDLISGIHQETKYQCDVCSKEFISLEGFEYHKNNQHVEKEVKKKRKKKGGLYEENKGRIEHEESERLTASFVCKICTASFILKSSLQAHLKSHNVTKNMEVKTGSHQCCICPRSFASSDGLKYHLATHTGERRYSCGQCGKKFIKKTHLSEHIATHSEVKYFKCLRCPRTFSTHSAYRKHVKHFPGPHSFPCNKCGKLFTKESMIEKHMCVDLVKITMAPEVKALLSEDMIEEYLCLAEEQVAEELALRSEGSISEKPNYKQGEDVKSEDQSGSHSCYKCFKIFPSLSSLQTHQLDHIGKQNYQCRFCPESFRRADAFGAHIRNHLGSTPYMCLKCNRKFISPLTLSMHAKNYPGDHSFTCKKCQRWFPSEKRVERHECILQNSEIFVCACNLVFKSWNELLQHAGTKPYKCCSCDLKYPTLIALARHIKKHTGIKPFSCEACGKSFRAKNNYLYHKNVHMDIKEIQCEHCDFKSKSQKRMDFHLFRKHDIGSNTTSTLCPFCGIIFPYLAQMKKHVEIEHGNEFILEESKDEKKTPPSVLCTLCGKLLNNKYTLANHMKKVHDPNGPKEEELKCEVCGEKFRSAKRLQRHAEVHEAPDLRTCEICNKEFYFAKDLRKHMRKHDTNKPYSCLRCGKNFKVSVSLKYHSSICGNVSQRSAGGKKKKEGKLPSDVHYDLVEPLDLNNRSYSVVCGSPRTFVWKKLAGSCLDFKLTNMQLFLWKWSKHRNCSPWQTTSEFSCTSAKIMENASSLKEKRGLKGRVYETI